MYENRAQFPLHSIAKVPSRKGQRLAPFHCLRMTEKHMVWGGLRNIEQSSLFFPLFLLNPPDDPKQHKANVCFFLPSIMVPSFIRLRRQVGFIWWEAQSCSEEYKSSILSDEPHSVESTRRKTAVRDSYTMDQSGHLLYFRPDISMCGIFLMRWKRQKKNRSSWYLMNDAVLVPERGIKLSLPFVFFNSNTVFCTVDAKRSLSGTLILMYTYLSRERNVLNCIFSYFSIFCHYRLIWFPGRRQIQSLWRQMMTLVWEEPAQVSKSAIPNQHWVWVGWIFEGTSQVVDCCFTLLHKKPIMEIRNLSVLVKEFDVLNQA